MAGFGNMQKLCSFEFSDLGLKLVVLWCCCMRFVIIMLDLKVDMHPDHCFKLATSFLFACLLIFKLWETAGAEFSC